MKKEYTREISVIRTTNDLILRTDIYYTLRNYSKDDFSNLPGKASVWSKLVDPIADHHDKVLQMQLKHVFFPKQPCILLEQVKKYLTVNKMRGLHLKSEDSRVRIALKFKAEQCWTLLGMTFREMKQCWWFWFKCRLDLNNYASLQRWFQCEYTWVQVKTY